MLSALIWIPLLGALLIGCWPGPTPPNRFRAIALIVSSVVFVWSVVLGIQFDAANPHLQFPESLVWLEALGLSYRLGVDGLSLPLLILNGLLTVIALAASDQTIQRPRFYYALMLLLSAGVAGTFLSQNLLLFFLFYEIELIPLYLLIAIWGGVKRGYAATKFLIYTAVSGILILAGSFGLAWLSGSFTFDYAQLVQHTLPLGQQIVLLLVFLAGFGIKIPLVPLHTWLPDAHVEASTPVSVMLAGILLKLGTYGLLRFGLNLFPDAWQVLAPWLAAWAVLTVLYGSFAAIAQKDMKKMVAYSSVGHMGYILLAAAAATPLSLLGSVLQMVSHGLISALLFLLVGLIYTKTGTRNLDVLQGLLNPERGLPVVGSLMVLAVMASAGIPGMVGFIAEFLIFRGSFPVFPIQTLLCMVGTILTGVCFLLLLGSAFFGRLKEPFANLPSVSWGERTPAIVLAVLIIILGLQPSWMIGWSENTTTAMLLPPTPAIAQSLDPAALPCSNITLCP